MHACCNTEQLCNRTVRVVEFTGRIYIRKKNEEVKEPKRFERNTGIYEQWYAPRVPIW